MALDLKAIRHIHPGMAADRVARVDAMFEAIEREHGVKIALAVESGSRAWGFPSPDSDYDGRFLYVRPIDDYLSVWPRRDVIEFPPDGEIDVNGWDVVKALALLVKGNAVVIEWLMSPIAYRGDAKFRSAFLSLAHEVAPRAAIGRHYLKLGQRQRQLFLDQDRPAALKKVFYVMRSAATLRWLRLHPGISVAPMNYLDLMAQCAPPDAVAKASDDLLRRKAQTRELGAAPIPAALAAFIDDELQAAGVYDTRIVPRDETARKSAETFFRAVVRRFYPGG
jgi:hypothetical protein